MLSPSPFLPLPRLDLSDFVVPRADGEPALPPAVAATADGEAVAPPRPPDAAAALPRDRALYDLTAVVNHAGSLRGGHYTCYARATSSPAGGGERGQWLHLNDSRVSRVKPSQVRDARDGDQTARARNHRMAEFLRRVCGASW